MAEAAVVKCVIVYTKIYDVSGQEFSTSSSNELFYYICKSYQSQIKVYKAYLFNIYLINVSEVK